MAAISSKSRKSAVWGPHHPRQSSLLLRLFLVLGALLFFGICLFYPGDSTAGHDKNKSLLFLTNQGKSKHDASTTSLSSSLLRDENQQAASPTPPPPTSSPTSSPTPAPVPRILIFDATPGSYTAGAGQMMHGLLAAHLLAREFDRTVCVVWPEFFQAFDYVSDALEQAPMCHPENVQKWLAMVQQQQQQQQPQNTNAPIVQVYTAENSTNTEVDECLLYETLKSPQYSVVVFRGNTYPGWPSNIPSNLFQQHYRPKPELLHALPFDPNTPATIPKVVVHLRAPDSTTDNTKATGCDGSTLYHLGEWLRGDRYYVVSNRIDYIDHFHDCCGWSYDKKWGKDKLIRHSVLPLEWRHKDKNTVDIGADPATTVPWDNEQVLKLWTDWYTLLLAPQVYHTDSLFSKSAIHWKGTTTTTTTTTTATRTGQQQQRYVSMQILGLDAAQGNQLRLEQTQFRHGKLTQQARDYYFSTNKNSAAKKPPFILPLVERKRVEQYMTDDKAVYLRFCRDYKRPGGFRFG